MNDKKLPFDIKLTLAINCGLLTTGLGGITLMLAARLNGENLTARLTNTMCILILVVIIVSIVFYYIAISVFEKQSGQGEESKKGRGNKYEKI